MSTKEAIRFELNERKQFALGNASVLLKSKNQSEFEESFGECLYLAKQLENPETYSEKWKNMKDDQPGHKMDFMSLAGSLYEDFGTKCRKIGKLVLKDLSIPWSEVTEEDKALVSKLVLEESVFDQDEEWKQVFNKAAVAVHLKKCMKNSKKKTQNSEGKPPKKTCCVPECKTKRGFVSQMYGTWTGQMTEFCMNHFLGGDPNAQEFTRNLRGNTTLIFNIVTVIRET